MDGDRFDGIAKALAGGSSRRRLLKGLIGASTLGIGSVLGFRTTSSRAQSDISSEITPEATVGTEPTSIPSPTATEPPTETPAPTDTPVPADTPTPAPTATTVPTLEPSPTASPTEPATPTATPATVSAAADTGILKITAVGPDNAPSSWGCFYVFRRSEGGLSFAAKACEEDNVFGDGITELSLAPGDYLVNQGEPPYNWGRAMPFAATVTAGQVTAVNIQYQQPAELTIIGANADGQLLLRNETPGAYLELYPASGPAAELYADRVGNLYFNPWALMYLLPAGDFILRETYPPFGYLPADGLPVSLAPGESKTVILPHAMDTVGEFRARLVNEAGQSITSDDVTVFVYTDAGDGVRGREVSAWFDGSPYGVGNPNGTINGWIAEPGAYVASIWRPPAGYSTPPMQRFTVSRRAVTDLTFVFKAGITCAEEFIDCNGTCVDPMTNAQFCGGCQFPCPPGIVCTGGECQCPPGHGNCFGICADFLNDPSTCGGCFNECRPWERCEQGVCTDEPDCPTPTVPCGGICVDTASDGSHCGQCGNICQSGHTCVNGSCIAPQLAPRIVAGPRTIDLRQSAATVTWTTDRPASSRVDFGQTSNLGRTRTLSGVRTEHQVTLEPLKPGTLHYYKVTSANDGGSVSKSSQFRTRSCLSGTTRCGNACVNLQTDPANCGSCGHSCTPGLTCRTGQCVVPTTWEFRAPFAIKQFADKRDPAEASAEAAACKGLNGLVTKQQDLASGKLGYHLFGYGGYCGNFNSFTSSNPPSESGRVVSLLGVEFVPPVTDDYRIRIDVALAGQASVSAEKNAFGFITSFLLPGLAGAIAELIPLSDPANLLPSAGVVDTNVLLKINSAYTRNPGQITDLVAASVPFFPDEQETTFLGTVFAETTMRLTAGQAVRIYGGLETTIKLWGHASASAKTLDSRLSRILIRRL